ncbi:hypothetical protein [Pseudomonas sp. COR18]|uniref:hypothetical protein n=1 Tax=Pseudomonas sp. COR18 TaxID=3399680 RepID=UPI003B00C6B3
MTTSRKSFQIGCADDTRRDRFNQYGENTLNRSRNKAAIPPSPCTSLTEQTFLKERGFFCTGENAVLRSDDHLAQFASLRAGLGIGVCASQLARRHGLVRVLPERVDFPVDAWIAMDHDLKRVRRVTLVFDALSQALSRFLTDA